MPLREHLRELRRRVLLAVLGVLGGAVLGWIFYPDLFEALQAPVLELAEAAGGTVRLNFTGVAAPLDMQITVSLFAGVIVSSPWWIYQLWAFVTPGLTRRERWYALGFVATGVPLFLGGAALAWVFMPRAIGFLAGFTPTGAVQLLDAQGYLGFVMRMVLAFGIAFLLPVFIVALDLIGIATGRGMLAGWRWAVLLAFVFGAMATPSGDPISMFALALPVCALYFGAIGICLLNDRRRARRAAAEGLLDSTAA